MSLLDLSATLEYWLTAGVDFLSGDQLRFPPPPDLPQRPAAPIKENKNLTTYGRSHSPPANLVQPERPQPVKDIFPKQEEHTTLITENLSAERRKEKLDAMAASLALCSRCELARLRTNMVFGVGDIEAHVLFVGEGPGAEEDRHGEPFVGDAGKLLNKMIHAIGMQRHEVYIANVVKCRPPNNRNPLPEEINHCQNFLFEQIETVRPKVIFALGRFAILCLTGYTGPIEKIRGKTRLWRGIPIVPSYHPAFYLRSPSRKKAAWEDLLRMMQILRRTNTDVPEKS